MMKCESNEETVICEKSKTCEARGYCTHAREHEGIEDEDHSLCSRDGHNCEIGGFVTCVKYLP